MGFNMIRKHVKVEPARWYCHCDQLGMLVWQDMPSGDLGARWEPRPAVEGIGYDMERSAESEADLPYRMECHYGKPAQFSQHHCLGSLQ